MPRTIRTRPAEAGVALLISLFALLLISVVGVALIMASGTDSALTGNYRSATNVYYAALAGLEEGRGRMLAKSPNYLPTALGLPAGATPGPGQVWYIINPLPGEVVAPWDTSTATTFPDNEYSQEFGANPPAPGGGNLQVANSVFSPPSLQPTPGPIYKWVRINMVTVGSELANGVNVNRGTTYAPITPVLYANNHLNADPVPGGVQAFEITSLAAMPNGSQRMLQYVVAPVVLNLTFPSALTLNGNNVDFVGPNSPNGPNSVNFVVNGNDLNGTLINDGLPLPLDPLPSGCIPSTTPLPAIGYTNSADQSSANIVAGAKVPANYEGAVPPSPAPPSPSVVAVPVSQNVQTVGALNTLVNTLAQNADAISYTNTDQSVFSGLNMSAANPKIVVVEGDLTLHSWHGRGYGILLVTGTFTYDPDASWVGIVLVIGQGQVVSSLGGQGVFTGAAFVASIVGQTLGPSSWSQTNGGSGIFYSSCWINAVQGPLTNKVLSFHEIPQVTP